MGNDFFDGHDQPRPPAPSYQGGGNGGYQNNQSGGGYQGGQRQGGYQSGQNSGYQNNQNNGGNYQRQGSGGGQGGGGYQGGQRQGGYQGGQSSGGGKGFQRNGPVPTHAYFPLAIVGNENPPPKVVEDLKTLITRFNEAGFTLRSRGVTDFDEYVEAARPKYHELHLPWREFETKTMPGVKKTSPFTFHHERIEAMAIMLQPEYESLKPGIRKIVASQLRPVLGKAGDSLAQALVVYTDDGAQCTSEVNSRTTGRAALAIMAATRFNIPVYNLARPDALQRLFDHFKL